MFIYPGFAILSSADFSARNAALIACFSICTMAATATGQAQKPQGDASSEYSAPSNLLPVAPHLGHAEEDQPPCARSEDPKRACRIRWRNLLLQSAAFNTFQNIGNAYTGYWFRWETTHGNWWQRYTNSVTGFRYWRWSDDDPLLDDYVGHPMMGAATNYIFIHNDPKSNYLEFANTRAYWHSRLKALAFSAAYSAEWKIGPFGEAGVGFTGDHYYFDRGKYTNGTGLVDFIVTPVGGTLWTVAEDYIDKRVVKKLEQRPHGVAYLTAISFLTPAQQLANLFALRPPWARDNRRVHSTWGDSEARIAQAEYAPRNKELGAWGGGSWLGPSHDYTGNFNLLYTHVLQRRRYFTLRLASNLTGSVVSEPARHPQLEDRFHQRRRVYGTGASPFGLQLNLLSAHKVQPFVDGHAGAVYFLDRISADNGTKLNLSFDAGAGLQIMKINHRSVTVGYRYQRFTSTNFGAGVPGMGNHILFAGVSLFR